MVLHGRVENGVVALPEGTSLPEGAAVIVVVGDEHAESRPQTNLARLSEEERRRVRESLDRLAKMPDENPGDTFSGADHDDVLYGKRQ